MNGAIGCGDKLNNKNDIGSTPISISKFNKPLNDKKFINIGAGYYHSIALTDKNEIYTWGYNGCYNSCIYNINNNDNNQNNNNNKNNKQKRKKIYNPHYVDINSVFNNNDNYKKYSNKKILKIFGGFYSSILMVQE